ncbi:MAG: hypothetical protein H7174_08475 [Flavobacterium sp.]|nr:hypothetical protein [Flavobacterium sp.]
MIKILFNPFAKFSDKFLIIFGIISTLLGLSLSWFFNAQFDGVLDLHFNGSINIYESLVLILIDIIILVVLLFALAKFINNKSRIMDVIIAILIARTPIYLLALMNINNKMFEIGAIINAKILKGEMNNVPFSLQTILIITSLISLLAIIWFSVLLFNGFKIATNLKERKHIVFFVITLLLAEIISKIVISYSI